MASGVYRTFEGQCERLHATLAAGRPSEPVVAEDADEFFEHAALYRLRASG